MPHRLAWPRPTASLSEVTPPSSTYRLQIRKSFTLDDAAAVVGYLRDLGVGAVYLSPVLQSTTGSDHGYDTTDPLRIDADRGGEEGWANLLATAADAGLQVVVDIVPNHLGISSARENPYWWDVLTHGQGSAYADWFDVDWSRPIVVPVLGDGAVLSIEDGELAYYEHRFPLAPGSWEPGEDPETVHERQHYRLVHHSRGDRELNYRRFFVVSTLAGVRQEDPAVFEATHRRVARMIEEGVAGLRVDHPDGLVDPGGYQQRLADLAPEAWITVEKILEPGERLPDWPVAGTTGYDAMREVNGVFIDTAGEAEATERYQRLTGDQLTSAEHVERGKRMIVDDLLVAEVERIAALAPGVADAAAAVSEVAVAFEVYRSYLPDGVADLDKALVLAEQRRPELASAFEALSPRLHDASDELARRFQQLSGATMAKGTEDTAFYRYARFIALNEVGADAGEFGIGLDDFHALQQVRQQHQPRSMTSLSTHDTKRGEDVRARLAVLAELGEEWERFAEELLSRSGIGNRAFAYFLAQTLVGVGPVEERERLHAYAEKAMREASQESSWTSIDAAYEEHGPGGDRPRLRRRRRPGRLAAAAGAGRAARLVQRPRTEAGPADHARGAGRLPGHRAVGGLAGRPGQPAAGRLRAAARVAGVAAECAPGRRHGGRKALGHGHGAPAPAGPSGAVLLLHPGGGLGAGRGPRHRLRPGRRTDRRDPAAHRAVPGRWLG